LPWFGKGVDEKKKKTTDIRDLWRFRFGEKSSNFHPRNNESQGDGGLVVNKVLFSSNSVSSDEQQKVGIELDFTTTNYDSDWGGACINNSSASDLQSDTDSIDSEVFLDSQPSAEDDRRVLVPPSWVVDASDSQSDTDSIDSEVFLDSQPSAEDDRRVLVPPSWVVDASDSQSDTDSIDSEVFLDSQPSAEDDRRVLVPPSWVVDAEVITQQEKKMCNVCNKSLDASQYSGNQWNKALSCKNRTCLECFFPYYCRRMGEEGAREFIDTAKQRAQLRRQQRARQRAMERAALAAMATMFDGQTHIHGLPIINTTTQEGLSHLESLILAKIRRGGWYYTGDSRMGLDGEILYNEGVGFIIRVNTMFCKPVSGGFVRLLTGDVGSTPDCLLQAIVHPICAGELICMYHIYIFHTVSFLLTYMHPYPLVYGGPRSRIGEVANIQTLFDLEKRGHIKCLNKTLGGKPGPSDQMRILFLTELPDFEQRLKDEKVALSLFGCSRDNDTRFRSFIPLDEQNFVKNDPRVDYWRESTRTGEPKLKRIMPSTL